MTPTNDQPPEPPPNLNGDQLPFWQMLEHQTRAAERAEDRADAREVQAIARDTATNKRIDQLGLGLLLAALGLMGTVLGVGLA